LWPRYSRSAHGMRNEMALIRTWAWEHLSSFSVFRKPEVFLRSSCREREVLEHACGAIGERGPSLCASRGQCGLLDAIQQRVRFARARFGHDDTMDVLIVLIGDAVRGEPTLKALYERLRPFASPFMALFERHALPCHSTLSRFLAALDQPRVEALRLLFQEDLVARTPFGSPPGGLWDRLGQQWLLADIDGTTQAARQRALPQSKDLPLPHRRCDRVCATGSFGRTRGQVGRTRTTVLHPYTHQWLGTFAGSGHGDSRAALRQALQALTADAAACALPLSHVIVRVDGWDGNKAPLPTGCATRCRVSLAGLRWLVPCAHRWVARAQNNATFRQAETDEGCAHATSLLRETRCASRGR
jgi:hypothetical protein